MVRSVVFFTIFAGSIKQGEYCTRKCKLMKIKSIIKLIRPEQWVKQCFIFFPMFFFGSLLDIRCWLSTVFAFIAFSFVASSIYCLNDLVDIEKDKKHPKKKMRPLASGEISKREGVWVMVSCMAVAVLVLVIAHGLAVFANEKILFLFCAIYFVLNVLYSVKLKSIAILDVFIISFGFVIRIFIGGFAAGVPVSHWIVMLTFLLSLFLALTKRRDDVVLYENTGEKVRENVNRYSISFLNQAIGITASITMVCYILYSVSEDVVNRIGNPYLYTTSFFVLAGIIRYLQLTIVDTRSGSPTKILLKDRFIQVCVLGWGILIFCLIYL